ncbi:hypothetical protein JCM10212_003925 [Sporobolomyces blumeae]
MRRSLGILPARLSRLQHTTSTRSAAVVNPTRPDRPRAPPAPAPRLPPQPFIPRPDRTKLQLESISTTPDDPSRSTTLHFVDPSSSATRPRRPDDPTSPSPSLSLSIPNLYLRDASVHPNHVHPSSRQRLFRTTDVPLDGKLVGYGVHDLPGYGECLVTEWTSPLSTAGMDDKYKKLSVVPIDHLASLLDRPAGDPDLVDSHNPGQLPNPRTWDDASLRETLVRTSYQDFMSSPEALFATLDGLVRDGIVFLDAVPTSPKAGQHTALRDVVERIGSIRKTWYGELWDVKAEEGSKNIAYTNLDLGLHMDLTHFSHPPRYQFLHSLLNSQIVGGTSYFVDSYAVARHLYETNRSTFETLSRHDVQFEYKNGANWTRWKRPTFELRPGSDSHLDAVNYSPPFQGNLPLSRFRRSSPSTLPALSTTTTISDDAADLAELHEALSTFSSLVDDPTSRFRFSHQLEPGQVVLFDNRRVLHARTAFDFVAADDVANPSSRSPDEGDDARGERGRWLKGAYMDGDEVWSRWRVLKEQLEADEQERLKKKGRTLFV